MSVSLRLKTIAGIALIEGVLLVALLLTLMDFIKSSNYAGMDKRASTTATLFATTTKNAVLSYDLASLHAFVNEVMQNPDLIYARVLTADGRVFAEGGDTQHFSKDGFSVDRNARLVDDGVLDIMADIHEGGVVYGRVELGLDMARLTAQIDNVYKQGTLIALSEMALVALFSFVLGGYLTRQLVVLQKAARQIAKGDFDSEVPVKSQDEVGEVARAFNDMVGNLKATSAERDQYEQELQQLNKTLELKVQQRTLALEEKHEQLEEAYKTLQETQDRLLHAEKMASIGVLAAGVAHEINNPVSYVLNNLQSMQEYAQTLEALLSRMDELLAAERNTAQAAALTDWCQQQDIPFIRDDIPALLHESLSGAERIRDIVAGLREFATPQQVEPVSAADVNEIIKQAVQRLQPECEAHACQLISQLNPLPVLNCQPQQLEQAIYNVLFNAIQAVADQGEVRVQTCVAGQHIRVSISDNGSGISQIHLEKIFDPFFTTKEVGSGTGLGLYVAYSIVKEHAGELTVASEEGTGSCFTITLPVLETQ